MSQLTSTNQAAEAVWDEWLSLLSPWELHYICSHRREGASLELVWHDAFVQGSLTTEMLDDELTEVFA